MANLVLYNFSLFRLTSSKKGFNSKPLCVYFPDEISPTGGGAGDFSYPSMKMMKNEINAVLTRGAKKLKPGKRIKLVNQENSFEIHIFIEEIIADSMSLVYFIISPLDYQRFGSMQALMKQYREIIHLEYGNLDQSEKNTGDFGDISAMSSLGNQQKKIAALLKPLMDQCGHSHLFAAQRKVEEIKLVMENSMNSALQAVENLEEMEEKADRFSSQAKLFENQSGKVATIQKRNYYKLWIIGALIVVGIVAFITVPLVTKSSNDGLTPPDPNATTAGAG